MADSSEGHEIEKASTTEGLPIAPSMAPTMTAEAVPRQAAAIGPRVAVMSAIAVVSAFIAQGLVRLISIITNLAFFGQLSASNVSPAANALVPWVIVVPVVGALIVGVMAAGRSAR